MTKPLLCLVTDRRRLARVLGAPAQDAPALLLQQITGAVAGGVDILQIREPDLEARELATIVRAALALTNNALARVFVNDRVDVALAARGHGVQLRHFSIQTTDVRRLAPQLAISKSVHTADDLAHAGLVDYLIAGTVFTTASKPEREALLGLDRLRTIVAAARPTPVLAIGGITEHNVGSVMAASAAGIAAIGAFIPSDATMNIAAAVQKRVEVLRRAFDASSTVQ